MATPPATPLPTKESSAKQGRDRSEGDSEFRLKQDQLKSFEAPELLVPLMVG
jgi:hypothetical protein